MSRSLKYIGGGLLSGIGAGMISEAAGMAKRNAALEKLRGEMARDDLKHKRNLERDELMHQRESGMLHTTVTEAGGEVTGITKGGETVATGAIEDVTASGKDPARVREAQWLVDNKIYPDLNTAYEATRTRVGMDPATVRSKALSWVSAQKDQYGRQKYTKPEEIAAGVQAYQKFIDGDTAGALEAFKAIEPKAAEDETGWLRGMWESITNVTDVDDEDEKPESGGAAPEGKGSREEPYKASKQAHIDWFKANAKPGDVIEVDGKLYRKE